MDDESLHVFASVTLWQSARRVREVAEKMEKTSFNEPLSATDREEIQRYMNEIEDLMANMGRCLDVCNIMTGSNVKSQFT